MTPPQLAVLRDRVARVRLEREQARSKADRVGLVVRVPAPAQAAGAVRYATPEERREARLRTYRESQRRKHRVCQCGGKMSTNWAVKMCKACWLAKVEPAHGTVSRYASRKFACRCELCRAAASQYHRDRRAAMVEWKQAA